MTSTQFVTKQRSVVEKSTAAREFCRTSIVYREHSAASYSSLHALHKSVDVVAAEEGNHRSVPSGYCLLAYAASFDRTRARSRAPSLFAIKPVLCGQLTSSARSRPMRGSVSTDSSSQTVLAEEAGAECLRGAIISNHQLANRLCCCGSRRALHCRLQRQRTKSRQI